MISAEVDLACVGSALAGPRAFDLTVRLCWRVSAICVVRSDVKTAGLGLEPQLTVQSSYK
jgi:hypothetical protein